MLYLHFCPRLIGLDHFSQARHLLRFSLRLYLHKAKILFLTVTRMYHVDLHRAEIVKTESCYCLHYICTKQKFLDLWIKVATAILSAYSDCLYKAEIKC